MTLDLPRLIGHRGAAKHAPENTLAGIRTAAAQGARWVEVDVKLTRDGVPILMHDEELGRTTDGRGKVAEHDYADIARLDAGRWFSPAFRGEPVPTLAACLELVHALGLGINLEIKPCPGREEETAGVALSMAYSLWPEGKAPPLVSSFEYASLVMARQVVPAWPIGFLIDRRVPDWREKADRVSAATINVNARKESAGTIAEYRASGRPVLAYTVNSVPAAREVFGWGVSAVFTDTPEGLAAVA
ncbi:MAG TPA: glycerophosphoryl diester phosphodiesterase [Azospirillaceae bacterium]|nr:glycerophosphoryl diester phosphodiesterase [Azospirillaceae bacterium]